MNLSDIKYYLRNTPVISTYYNKFLLSLKGNNFNYSRLPFVNPNFRLDSDKVRITLIVPSFESDFVFGGLSTALKIFNNIVEYTNAEGRILVLTGKYSKKSTFQPDGFDYNGEKKNIIFYEDDNKIPVEKNDFFIGTFWTTVFCTMPLVQKQKEKFNLKNRKLIYLIQDFEPGFFPWSTEYALADSTYKSNSEDILAVFNAKSLYEYFKNNHYSFGCEVVFSPQLNDELKKCLPKEKTPRKKQILIYGRPRVSRNVFEIIHTGLEIWSEKYPKAGEWGIISLGADFNNIKLKNNLITSFGKVSLNQYAKYMRESYAGISLMLSPHPSYPPLEMSTFGIKTITNSFKNKNLSNFNNNVYSINTCTPNQVFDSLVNMCNQYKNNPYGVPYIDNDYVKGGSLEKALNEISRYVLDMVVK